MYDIRDKVGEFKGPQLNRPSMEQALESGAITEPKSSTLKISTRPLAPPPPTHTHCLSEFSTKVYMVIVGEE